MGELQERAAAEFERLRQEEPERYREAAEAARQAVAAASPLLQGVQRFLEAPTWFESQRIVEQMPELLGDEADLALGRFIQIAHANRDEAAVAHLRDHRDLLCRARQAGIARTFAEKALSAEGLAAAKAAGLTPEEFLETQRAAEQMPP